MFVAPVFAEAVFVASLILIGVPYVLVTAPWFESLNRYVQLLAVDRGLPIEQVRAKVLGRHGIGPEVAFLGTFSRLVIVGVIGAFLFAAWGFLAKDSDMAVVMLVLAFMTSTAAIFWLWVARRYRQQVRLIRRAGRQVAQRDDLLRKAIAFEDP